MTEQLLLKEFRKYLGNVNRCWNYITPPELKEYMKKHKKNKYMLLDVRKPAAFKKGHIRGAKNIYWLDLLKEKNIKKLPKDKKIFIVCYLGHTSSQVLVMLKMLGYDATSVKFGMGVTPVKGVPMAGWVDYGFDVVH